MDIMGIGWHITGLMGQRMCLSDMIARIFFLLVYRSILMGRAGRKSLSVDCRTMGRYIDLNNTSVHYQKTMVCNLNDNLYTRLHRTWNTVQDNSFSKTLWFKVNTMSHNETHKSELNFMQSKEMDKIGHKND